VSDIFREIDEELRRENFAKLWERYGHLLVIAAVLIVLATASVVGWREYQARERRAESVRYAAALDLAQKDQADQAAKDFAALARDAGGGYAVLSRFEEAAMRAKAGDDAAATEIYNAIAVDTRVDPVYRDLATILAGLHGLATTEPKVIIGRLAPLTADGNAWRPSALELTALAQLKAGDKAAARDTYKLLADDLQAPQGLRARAAEMTAALGS
jgi:hypothetical protein